MNYGPNSYKYAHAVKVAEYQVRHCAASHPADCPLDTCNLARAFLGERHDGPNDERDAGALAIEFVEQQPCPRWPDATALKCAKKGEEYPRCRYCDAARAIRRTHATGIPQEKS